jgi:peptide/nickel transport system permease protein
MRRLPGILRWGAGLSGLLLAIALAAPLLAPYDPYEQLDPVAGRYRSPGTRVAAVHLADGNWRLADRVERVPGGLVLERLGQTRTLAASEVVNLTPSGVADRRVYLLGTDKFGRDVLSRMLYGARISLCVGLFSVALALSLGVAVGSAAAMAGPWTDTLLMRIVDALLAFPWLFLMILLSALFSPGPVTLVLLLGGGSWMGISRLARAELVSLREREFVLAARSIGQTPLRILLRHLLPNALTPVTTRAVLLLGNMILIEASLSFLGVGIQAPIPSWGNMIFEGRQALSLAWWMAVFPGAALSFTVIAFNLLADGLRDALDPKSSRQPAMLPAS